jgi:hypothetical protein
MGDYIRWECDTQEGFFAATIEDKIKGAAFSQPLLKLALPNHKHL